MTHSSYKTTGIDNYNISNITDNITGEQKNDKIRILFEYLFTTNDDLIKQNKFLILTLLNYINQNSLEIVKSFLNDSSINDIHISLIKSSLLITDNIEVLLNSRIKVHEIFEKKYNQLNNN